MNAPTIDPSILELVARRLLGAPNPHHSTRDQLRFGTNASVAVEIAGDKCGSWYDHEAGRGGGVFELLARELKLNRKEATHWLLTEHGVVLGTAAAQASRRIVATYDYRDEGGNLLFQVVRYEPKAFSQRRPDGNGGWIPSVKDLRPVPYKLPELLSSASDPTVPVFIVEGEKDVDALRAIGLVATCNPSGANKRPADGKPYRSKWPTPFAPFFNARSVVVIPDNDEAGHAHARSLAEALVASATKVRTLKLPGLKPKGDVSDWLEAGGTAAKLLALAEAAPEVAAHGDLSDMPVGDFEATEDGVAQAFAEQRKDDLRYCHHAQSWFVWTGAFWRRDDSKLAFAWAREICRRYAGRSEARERPKISKAAFCAAVERFAQADRTFAVTADQWDSNPWLLGTPGGTVDLRTGVLRPADRADFITKRTAVAPTAPGALHPEWTAFLDSATGGDKELQAFLQRFVGYCLTGDVTEEVLAFLYGEGGTGKGTFLGAIVAVLADYAVSVPIDVFTTGSRLPLEYYRAQMAGSRLVTASETEVGTAWSESQIKEMTGNEAPLSGRHPYGKPFSFMAQFKLIFAGNHAPRLKGRSKAMERRLRMVPFKHKPLVADRGLKERLKLEYTAILRWCIDGCLKWQQQRLGTCAAVTAATRGYFDRQDYFGRWLEERCILDKTLATKPADLQADYNSWAKNNGEEPLTPNEFAEQIDFIHEVCRKKTNGVRLIRGMGLRVQDSQVRYGRDD